MKKVLLTLSVAGMFLLASSCCCNQEKGSEGTCPLKEQTETCIETPKSVECECTTVECECGAKEEKSCDGKCEKDSDKCEKKCEKKDGECCSK